MPVSTRRCSPPRAPATPTCSRISANGGCFLNGKPGPPKGPPKDGPGLLTCSAPATNRRCTPQPKGADPMITDPAARTARESALETSFPKPNACSGTSEAACWLAALGLPVAPGEYGAKVPHKEQLGSGFHWPDVASTDPGQVGGWFTRPWHFSTILLACGVTFDVLDIDVRSGENGYESVPALEDEIGAPLTSQLVARTPSGA